MRKEQCTSILTHLKENVIGSSPDTIYFPAGGKNPVWEQDQLALWLYDVGEYNLYALFIQPFTFWESASSLWDNIELLLMKTIVH